MLLVAAVALFVFLKNRPDKRRRVSPDDKFYTYADVQKDISYLAEDDEKREKLNRLINPLKKSNNITRSYLESVADIFAVDKSVYKDILKGYHEKDSITQDTFNKFYDAMIGSGKIEGIKTSDYYVKAVDTGNDIPNVASSGDPKAEMASVIAVYSDDFKYYEADNMAFPKDNIGKIIKAYSRNDVLFRYIGLSDSSYTLSEALLISKDDKKITFLHNSDIISMNLINNIDIKEQVVDITFSNKGVSDIKPSGEEITDKVIEIGDKIKLSKNGIYDYDPNFKVYDLSSKEPHEVESSQFLVGYKDLKLYVNDKMVKAVVITNAKLESQEIKVLINDTEYKSVNMRSVIVSSDEEYEITYQNGKKDVKAAGEETLLTPGSYGVHDTLSVTTTSGEGKITINSIERNSINPSYRGKLDVVMMGDYLYVINKLPLEEYLYAVVSSGIPETYGANACKAFAIVARGYALKMIERGSYSSYGADIDDSNLNLLYNYYPENADSIAAVDQTYGMIMMSGDTVIMPYHFLTSAGVTCSNKDIYNEEALPYYPANYETEDSQKVELSDEAAFKKFIDESDKNMDLLEVDEPYYRWKVSYTQEEMDAAVSSVLKDRINNTVDSIYVKEKKEEDKDKKTDDKEPVEDTYIPADAETKLGKIESITITKRSEAGVVLEIIIVGKENTIKVTGQTNIRYIFNPIEHKIIKNDGSEAVGYQLLPSPFYYVEKTDAGYEIKGGGFGNGVGLSMSGAEILDEKGYSYDSILEHYYGKIKTVNMFGIVKSKDSKDEKSTESTQE